MRYKKPVGIYWLQALAVKTGEALGVRDALTTIWLYRIPSLLGALGAVLLTYWTALAFVTRRAAVLAGLMMATCILLERRRPARQDRRRCCSPASVAAMGALARVYLPEQRKRLGPQWPLAAAGDLLDRAGRRRAAQGPGDRDGRGADGRCAGRCRSLGALGSWCCGRLPGIVWFALLVLPWFLAIVVRSGDSFFAELIGHDLLAKLDQRAGIARRAARLLSSSCSGSRSGRARRWPRWRRRRSGRRGASPARSSCWPGSCRPGSCSSSS